VKSYREIVGDGGSKVVEQVEVWRARIEQSLGGVRHLVAVGSGKGGVGKSTLTMGLARALRRRGHEVAVLDADLNGPSQARLAGLVAAPLVPGEEGLLSMPRTETGIGVVSLGTLVPDTEAVDFDSVADGDSHVWRSTREFAFLGQLLAGVRWGELDYLLVDLPPGAERTFQYAEYLGEAVEFVLVTIPSDLASSVVSRSVAALRKTPNRLLGYVENMSGYYCAECGVVKPLFAETRPADLGIPRLGSVPFDPAFGAARDEDSPASRAVDAVATAVAASVRGSVEEVRR